MQVLPNNGQSVGLHFPCSISPQRHPGGFFALNDGTENFFRASNAAYSSRSTIPLFGIIPSPRHTASAGSIYFSTSFFAAVLPSRVTTRG